MSERKPLSAYRAPETWPVWLGMGLLRLVCLLPHRVALAIGRLLGRGAHALGGSRRAIVRRNLELCFPDLEPSERDALAKAHFLALGMALIEMGLGRWASDRHLESLTRLEGIEHVRQALDAGREFLTELQRSGREVSADNTIEKRDIKKMVRSLRRGRAVWYAPDQSYSRKGAELVEFFGVPSMHTTATSTLARLGEAVTIPFFPLRKPDGTYEMTLLPPLENFPSDDPVADTRRYVEILEAHIRKVPEQYFWIHRKFKDLPEGYPDYYADLDALK